MAIEYDVDVNDLNNGDLVTAYFGAAAKYTLRGEVHLVGKHRYVWDLNLHDPIVYAVDLEQRRLPDEPPVGSVAMCMGECGRSFVRLFDLANGWVRIGQWPVDYQSWIDVQTPGGCTGPLEVVHLISTRNATDTF